MNATESIKEIIERCTNDNADTHTFTGFEHKITVSDNPRKIIISSNFTGEVKTLNDLNSLEISMLALINSLVNGRAHEDKES